MTKTLFSMSTEEKEALLSRIAETARPYEEKYGGCARSTLAAIQDHLRLCDDQAFQKLFQSTDALAGGVGYHQQICGAVIAGVMAISLAYGPDRMERLLPQNDATLTDAMLKHREAVERAHDFVKRFEKSFKGTTCKEVQHSVTGRYWDMRKQEDLALFITKPHHDRCGRVTGQGARLAAEVILESSDHSPDPTGS
jgi:C_GCAxxG_C_C family probable redox protein